MLHVYICNIRKNLGLFLFNHFSLLVNKFSLNDNKTRALTDGYCRNKNIIFMKPEVINFDQF